jgi:hypothetical protein
MQVIKDQKIVTDSWQQIAGDEELPAGDVIVSLGRWQVEREQLLKRPGKLGVCINGDHKLRDIADDLKHFDLIALVLSQIPAGSRRRTADLSATLIPLTSIPFLRPSQYASIAASAAYGKLLRCIGHLMWL